jgi:dipeptidase D
MPNITDLEPKLLWKHFNEIRKIPRCSKHEEKIRDYVLSFGKKMDLAVKTDKTGNIVITKPASPGYQQKPCTILQGHMDMVCEKNSDSHHDFSRDPIKVQIKGDILTAQGTTLGADNGIGIATSLAILEDTTIKHGPLEVLFTVDEETGLTGAFALNPDMLTGKLMLNLDSEDFGVITVGCAGGGDSQITLPISREKNHESGMTSLKIVVTGLRGGHSGVDIHEQRGNAIKILARILWTATQKFSLRVSDIQGGDKHNAIPRESWARISIPANEKEDVIALIREQEKDISLEIHPIDPKFKVEITPDTQITDVLTSESHICLLNLLHGLPHGIQKMSYDIPDLVETSTNLATVSLKENTADISLSSRSSIASALQNLRGQIRALATLAGAKVKEEKPYPGWKPNLDSPLLKLSKDIFKDMFSQEPKVEAIHAGLECGIIGEKFPGMDMISIGPTIKYPHSPEEQVHIKTVEKFYHYALKILEKIP